jgi:hypothetical protein
MKRSDARTFAIHIDLCLEHGSTMEGDKPSRNMLIFGDEKILIPQKIADVISLNK